MTKYLFYLGVNNISFSDNLNPLASAKNYFLLRKMRGTRYQNRRSGRTKKNAVLKCRQNFFSKLADKKAVILLINRISILLFILQKSSELEVMQEKM